MLWLVVPGGGSLEIDKGRWRHKRLLGPQWGPGDQSPTPVKARLEARKVSVMWMEQMNWSEPRSSRPWWKGGGTLKGVAGGQLGRWTWFPVMPGEGRKELPWNDPGVPWPNPSLV